MKKLLLLSLCLLLASCASIVDSGDENVMFLTNIDDAKITIQNKNFIPISRTTSPSVVNLKKGRGFFMGETYTVTAEKEGYESQTQVLHTTLNGWYLGNIIFGGLIGLLLVDPATGAMWSFDTNTLIFNLDIVEE